MVSEPSEPAYHECCQTRATESEKGALTRPGAIDASTGGGLQGAPELVDLAASLRNAIMDRWPATIWRETKYYVAGEVNGETFIAYRPRRLSVFLGLTLPEDYEDARLASNDGKFNWRRITKVLSVREPNEIDIHLLSLVGRAIEHAGTRKRSVAHHGITVRDLIVAGLLTPGTKMILKSGQREVATAVLSDTGEIVWNGVSYRSPSDKAFAKLLGPTRTTLNGWTHWSVVLPSGHTRLADLREQLIDARGPDVSLTESAEA